MNVRNAVQTGAGGGEKSARAAEQQPALFLRLASVGVACGLWVLAHWLNSAQPIEGAFGTSLTALALVSCGLFLALGALLSDQTVRRVWKAIGKVLVYLFLIT